MPAVVIVNATRSIGPQIMKINFKHLQECPDEFNDLFKKFFDERPKIALREHLLVLVLVLSCLVMDIL